MLLIICTFKYIYILEKHEKFLYLLVNLYYTTQATMLKKMKSKRRMTDPHISPAVLSLSTTSVAAGSSAAAAAITSENGDKEASTST